MAFGLYGTRKSTSVLEIADQCPSSDFYVVDNEFNTSNYDRLIEKQFPHLQNVTVLETDPEDWDEYIDAIRQQRLRVGPNDWLVVDSTTPSWDAIQGWYIDELYNKNIGDYFMEIRRQAAAATSGGGKDKSGHPLAGSFGKHWDAIKKVYYEMYREFRRCKGHIYITAQEGKVYEEEDKETRDLYVGGKKPKGEGQIAHAPHTVLWMEKTRDGEFQYTTIKNRGEEEDQYKIKYNNFALDFLVRVGKWKVQVME